MQEQGLLKSTPSKGGEVNYDDMIADMEMKLPENLKEGWNRVIAAGMKFLFDKQTNSMINDYLDGEGDMPTKLGEGAAGLIAFLDKESRGAVPKELVIPAGIALMIEVVKYVQKSGDEVTTADFAQAIQIFMEKILGVYGATPEQFEQTLELASKDQPQGAMQ
jgi:hypothetical protein